MDIKFEIGQVWSISWSDGDPLTPSFYSREAMLLGLERNPRTGAVTRLYFPVGMAPNFKGTTLTPEQFAAGNPTLLRQIVVE